MNLFRIASGDYINDLSGTGAKLYGGRWNHNGTPLLYCSENISLSILEILVHFDGLTIPNNLFLLHLELADKYIDEFPKTKFKKIQKYPNAEIEFKKEGQRWIKLNNALALKVPSIIIPGEFNILLNPLNENFKTLKKIKKEKLELDQRLFVQ